MQKIKYPILFVVFLFKFFSTAEAQPNKVKNIVVFFSLGSNLPSYQIILENFRNTLSETYDEPFNLQVEHLDLDRISEDKYAKYLIEQYNEKFKNIKIDLLITVGPGINPVLIRNGFEALKICPTINIELPKLNETFKQVAVNGNILEIKLKYKIGETIKSAFSLFPKNKDVYIISGNSNTDKYFTPLTKEAVRHFDSSYHFKFCTDITIDSTLQLVKKIPASAMVIVPMYLSDKNNIPYSTPEAMNLIANNCKAPVFPIADSFLKKSGGIGGYIFSYVNLGNEVGRISIEILNGKRFRDIIVDTNRFYQNIYDWQQLKRWNLIDSKVIPPDSIFYNKEIDFLDKYRKYFVVILLFLISQSIVILYLIKLYRKQKELARQQAENEIIHHKLIREERLFRMAELTASLSHELNQPLTAILYSAQAGMRFLKSDKLSSGQAQEIFENIIEDDKRAGSLISSVRSLMKLETREKEKININTVIQDTINIFSSQAIKQKIQIKTNMWEEPVVVFGDKIQIQQVVLNLLSNAAAAMEKTSGKNKIIEISSQLEKDLVTASVRDYGQGISDEIKTNLFKAFNTSQKSGFGIGLALSRSIIEKHGGEIMGENIPGGGAKFSFRLKVIKDE